MDPRDLVESMLGSWQTHHRNDTYRQWQGLHPGKIPAKLRTPKKKKNVGKDGGIFLLSGFNYLGGIDPAWSSAGQGDSPKTNFWD